MTTPTYPTDFRVDDRLETGLYYPTLPLQVEAGDRVGVVLLHSGVPQEQHEVEDFIERVMLDPVIAARPLRRSLRRLWARFIAETHAKTIAQQFDMVGGGARTNQLIKEKVQALETRLQATNQAVSFKVYLATRYARPSIPDVVARMKADGITQVILLPLYPQYAQATTGSLLLWWKTLEEAGQMPEWPTVAVLEYATHRQYIQALSERIEQGLQRFSRECRCDVHLVFATVGLAARDFQTRRTAYQNQLRQTVQASLALALSRRPFSIAVQKPVRFARWGNHGRFATLRQVARTGAKDVLIIPVSDVCDHVQTDYILDVAWREQAQKIGLRQYEVITGLNTHPAFVEALCDMVCARLQFTAAHPQQWRATG